MIVFVHDASALWHQPHISVMTWPASLLSLLQCYLLCRVLSSFPASASLLSRSSVSTAVSVCLRLDSHLAKYESPPNISVPAYLSTNCVSQLIVTLPSTWDHSAVLMYILALCINSACLIYVYDEEIELVSFQLGIPNVSFIDRRLSFGQVPLNLTTTRVATLTNSSMHHAYFQVTVGICS